MSSSGNYIILAEKPIFGGFRATARHLQRIIESTSKVSFVDDRELGN